MKRRHLPAFLCIILCMILPGCINYKPFSRGNWNEIYVIADRSDWEPVAGAMAEIFEKGVRTPQNEKIFSIQHILPSVFSQFREQKNLIILSSLQSSGSGSLLVKQMLSPDARRGVESGDYYVFIRKNELARNQLFMLLVSNTPEELKNKLTANHDFLFSTFYQWMTSNVAEAMYERGEQTDVEDLLFKKYQWRVRIPEGFAVAAEDTANHFVWLRQRDPDRFFAVHWTPSQDGNELTRDWIIARRNWMGKTFLDSMEVEKMFLQTESSELNGRSAIHAEGLWKIERLKAGGPFQSWAFYDEQSKRIYLIDVSVYSPGKTKLPYLQRLVIMAQTFNTERQDKRK